ncbi:MAG: hypothetical protein PF517_16230 [Salinivirgaceae bacterium]|jgi:hypothetical protein|nr:hypothetical protein [Salinivirgaceae bacterium]
MKKLAFIKRPIFIISFFVVIVSLSGCGVNSGLMNQLGVNGTNSNIVLQKNNFKVVGTVSGEASDSYIFLIGGNKKNLVAQAKQNMIENAKLEGTSKAIINVTLEEHTSLIIVYIKRTITVHGTVIEFTE